MTSSLTHYRLLGRSGLRVSPLALGTMTFGTDWGWGSDEADARRIFDAYVDRGGNFVDTASNYTNGTSEKLVGAFAEGKRDRLVLATKYSLASAPGDPNSGGNHRKNMVRTVEQSLQRLRTDHLDLLYLHTWDATTPGDEIMRAFDDLVRAGKVLYAGISDTPAWQVARMQTMAELRGWSPFVALQIEYSLVQRTVERELVPMAKELGLGVVPWSPLGMGVLTGKYSRADLTPTPRSEGGRRDMVVGMGAVTERTLAIADAVSAVAKKLERTPAQVAVAWTLCSDAVAAPIVGARTLAQLEDNLGALDVVIPAELRVELEAASAVELGFPHDFLASPAVRQIMTGGAHIEARRT